MNKVPIAWHVWILLGLIFFSCGNSNSKEAVRLQQYYAHGELLYSARCSNCHQKSGRGLGLLYPPLEKSDYLDNHFSEVICLIKNGRKGEIIVNGKSFNQPMPGVPTLTELEIAELVTFLYNSWGRERGITETQQVAQTIEKCSP